MSPEESIELVYQMFLANLPCSVGILLTVLDTSSIK
jgi:hypothetical protein